MSPRSVGVSLVSLSACYLYTELSTHLVLVCEKELLQKHAVSVVAAETLLAVWMKRELVQYNKNISYFLSEVFLCFLENQNKDGSHCSVHSLKLVPRIHRMNHCQSIR